MAAQNYPVSATVSDEAFAYLSKLPKAVLIDMYCQAFALVRGECDTPPPIDEIKADAQEMINLRKQ